MISPCEKICVVDPASGLCRGCGRSLTEIGSWTAYSDAERSRVMAELPQRLEAMRTRDIEARAGGLSVNRVVLWISLSGIALALAVLIARHDQDTIAGLTGNDFGSLAYNLALIVFLGGAVLVMFREKLSKALEAALLWIVIGLVLAFGYTYRNELRGVSERVMAELMPGRAAQRTNRMVEIVRGRNGDFQVAAQLNGSRVTMVLDTGASSVVLTQDAAKAAGLPIEVLNYSVAVDTANGRTRAAPVVLDRLAVGEIVERSVPALIAQPGQLRTNLLGMSFLNRLESWEVRGDKLQLRGHP